MSTPPGCSGYTRPCSSMARPPSTTCWLQTAAPACSGEPGSRRPPASWSPSRRASWHPGLDVTVYSSDGKRPPGHLARQGPPVLRWALFEAAKCAARPSSPDHAYYLQVKGRLGGNRAALIVARNRVRRCYHPLGALGDQAYAPPSEASIGGQVA